MSSEETNVFKKSNLDLYLKELAKEYKKLAGRNVSAEIILIGGAAIIESYGFRDITTDVDAIIRATSTIKDAINHVGDRFALPNGWLNADFQMTGSYTSKLLQYSSFYKTFNQILDVRVVTGEYLVAMKLRAFRHYKNDLSDIIGVLAEHEKNGDPLSLERIENAVINLYGSWNDFPNGAKEFITDTLSSGNYEKVYENVRQKEIEAKNDLIDFENKYPGALRTDNVDDVLQTLRAKNRRNDSNQ